MEPMVFKDAQIAKMMDTVWSTSYRVPKTTQFGLAGYLLSIAHYLLVLE